MSVSMALANLSLLCLELPLSPLSGFLMEVPLHFGGFCTLKFPRNFPPISLMHQFHAVSFQVLILDSLSSSFMFFFRQVGFYLESSPCVFLVLYSFLLWYILLVLFLSLWIFTCKASIFSSLWNFAFHYPLNFKILNFFSAKTMRSVGVRSWPSS